MKEEPQTNLVHRLRLRERQRLANEPRQSLAQSVVPPLDARGEAALFTRRGVLLGGDDRGVSLPEVGEAVALAVHGRDAPPELAATLPRAVADEVSDDLARGATERDPDPALPGSFQHERPEFIQLQVM